MIREKTLRGMEALRRQRILCRSAGADVVSERRSSSSVVLGFHASQHGRRPKGPLRPAMTMYPFPSASYSARSESAGPPGGRACGLGNLKSALCVPPRARGFPVGCSEPTRKKVTSK